MENHRMDKHEIVNRWRLILGDFAENSLPLDPENAELDGTLYSYTTANIPMNREYGTTSPTGEAVAAPC